MNEREAGVRIHETETTITYDPTNFGEFRRKEIKGNTVRGPIHSRVKGRSDGEARELKNGVVS
jgi:hypothetical protein